MRESNCVQVGDFLPQSSFLSTESTLFSLSQSLVARQAAAAADRCRAEQQQQQPAGQDLGLVRSWLSWLVSKVSWPLTTRKKTRDERDERERETGTKTTWMETHSDFQTCIMNDNVHDENREQRKAY
jgi:hypothetical protein